MPRLRLATFNVENLLMRCDFKAAGVDNLRARLTGVSSQAEAEKVSDVFDVLSEDDRTLTAQTLAATGADVCALQEVENLVTLTTFHNRYLARWAPEPYPHHVLFEGNDQRGIDVGLLSKLKVTSAVSHASVTFADLGIAPPAGGFPRDRVFRRDCLEVDIEKEGTRLTLFVCHFKSMHGGRSETRAVRDGEARGLRAIIQGRFDDARAAKWIILGDMNDYLEIDGEPATDHGLGALLDDGFATDLAMAAIDNPFERWSHHYVPLKQYTGLDHMFLPQSLIDLNRGANVTYVRVGVPWRSTRHTGFRLPGIGWAAPKASDHCPLVATIEF